MLATAKGWFHAWLQRFVCFIWKTPISCIVAHLFTNGGTLGELWAKVRGVFIQACIFKWFNSAWMSTEHEENLQNNNIIKRDVSHAAINILQ